MVELVIIGGGPAGLAAAYSAWQHGLRDILILERDAELGGILNQCIHNGFGLHRFGQQLTGPEYAGRYIEMLRTTGVRVELGTMVLEVTPDKQVHCVSRSKGYQIIQAKSIILCMGCRERTRGAIGTPGTRPAGIYTAGAAQRYVNMEGYLVGRRVLILGSGDIGLIMARRMTLEGAKVLACVEVMPYSGGLTRNIVQCLQDFDIPLYLSHTIVEIQGKKRVEKAIVAKVDENRRPIPGTEMEFDVDTILLSVGLIPENELTRQAGIPMDKMPAGKSFNERFLKRFSTPVQLYAPYSYDAASALIEAMKLANSAEPAKYLPLMQKVAFKGVTGNVAFDASGDIREGGVALYQHQSGKWLFRP